MNRRVIIASDSTSDLNAELLEQYHIRILPLGVTLGGQFYTDGVDIHPKDIYEQYEKTGELPKTSAVNIAVFESFMAECDREGVDVVLFTISALMSSTYHNACLAGEEHPNVYVVDTMNLSTGGGLLVIKAAELAEEGKSAAEIAETCAALAPFVDASFVIDSLEFLYKGGRCSALAALGANLLKLKPCIAVKNGTMSVAKKYRGRYADVLKTYVADRIGDGEDIDLSRVFITHAGCDEEIVAQCVEQVKALAPFAELHVTRASCTVSSHCGKNTLGVLFIRKTEVL